MEVGALRLEVRPEVVDALACEQPMEELERLLHPLDLLRHRRPVGAERGLVERLTGAEAEVRAPGKHRLERGPGLRDQHRVIARARRRHPGPQRHALGGLRSRAEPYPGVAGLARLPPRLEVIGAADPVEPGPLGLHRLAEQVVWRELLVGAEVEVAGHR